MAYILKEKERCSGNGYQFFIGFGHPCLYPNLKPCSRHGTKCVRCRWLGDGKVRGTRKEATVYQTLVEARKVLATPIGFFGRARLRISFGIVRVRGRC
jgi:hypothetical protein